MSSEDERYDLLIGFLEGELDDDERELVEEELAGPGDARDRLEAYRGLGAALAELEPPAPSAEARDGAYAAVMAAMAANASAEAPAEAPQTSAPAPPAAGVGQGVAGASGGAPRGQLLRFLSASAAAALVMVSALFYLRGLEAPQSKVASAPKKVAMERSAPRADPLADEGPSQPEAAEPPAAAPRPESARFLEEDEAADLELRSQNLGQPELDKEALGKALERKRAALAEDLELEEGADPSERAELLRPEGMRDAAAEPPAASEGQAPASPPAEPKKPETSQKPEAFAQGRGLSNDAAAPADAPESTTKDNSQAAPRGGEGQGGADRKEVTPAPQPRRRWGRESAPSGLQPDADGAPRQSEARPDAESGGGGGGDAAQSSTPKSGAEADDDANKLSKKSKPGKTAEKAKRGRLAGKVRGGRMGGEPSEEPEAERRDETRAEDGLREGGGLRFRRLRGPSAIELQPAWIVTRGPKRLLYVMEGTKLTQAPFPDLQPDARAKAKSDADPRVELLEVRALAIQRRALASQRKSVDLRVLERREDLLAIAKLELAREAKLEERSNELDAPGRPAGPGAGETNDGSSPTPGEAGESGQQRQPKDAKGAKVEAEQVGPKGPAEEDSKKTKAEDKSPLPAPAAGRDRAELLLRLLGAIETPRPSQTQLRRALRDAEARQAKARRRR